MSVVITKEYLNKHKTAKGAYTRRQLSVLGVKWPPPKNWKRLITGLVLSQSQADEFEQAKHFKLNTRRKLKKG